MKYAHIILSISHEKLDRPYTYSIPRDMQDAIYVGVPVLINFGNIKNVEGYVIEIMDEPDCEASIVKPILGIATKKVDVNSQLIELASWMHKRYACTMTKALQTVLPAKSKIKNLQIKKIIYISDDIYEKLEEARKKKHVAKVRLLEELISKKEVDYYHCTKDLGISSATIKKLEDDGTIQIVSHHTYRTPQQNLSISKKDIVLNSDQQKAVDVFKADYENDIMGKYLLFGITGSGKTEVYFEMIKTVIARGRQAVFLIPEISLTYQMISRIKNVFGDVVAIIHSKLSAGEKYDQMRRIENMDAKILVGPRSAIFAPFVNLGVIIMDEEHDGAYKSDMSPKYDAGDIASHRANVSKAAFVRGSATPSPSTYAKAQNGVYKLLELKKRAATGSRPAKIHVVDMREELKQGNHSIFSAKLEAAINEKLASGEQSILFLNRRGYANFVSCRACGQPIKCTHCDVSLTLHRGNRLCCHYCGLQIQLPPYCQSCGSPYIAGFGVGTQRLESITKRIFPTARVLRLDADATSRKNSGVQILDTFAKGEADILIGTQMVVKGHDFPNVTLVGIMIADTSLYMSSYDCAQRTYELITQASGRAGRGDRLGDVYLQTYKPEHYAIKSCVEENYYEYFINEMHFRKAANYPPYIHLLTIEIQSLDEQHLNTITDSMADFLKKNLDSYEYQVIGPANPSIYKIQDNFRKMIYIKHKSYDILLSVKKELEINVLGLFKDDSYRVQYDFI